MFRRNPRPYASGSPSRIRMVPMHLVRQAGTVTHPSGTSCGPALAAHPALVGLASTGVNIAGKRALHSSQLAEAFLTLTRDLEAVFGGGQGRMLDRQVSVFMGQPLLTTMVPAGARELGYLAGVPARFGKVDGATTWTQSSAAAMPRRAEAPGRQHGGPTLASSWPVQNSWRLCMASTMCWRW